MLWDLFSVRSTAVIYAAVCLSCESCCECCCLEGLALVAVAGSVIAMTAAAAGTLMKMLLL